MLRYNIRIDSRKGVVLMRSISCVDRKDRLTSHNRDYIVQKNIDNDRQDDENVENITYSLQILNEVDKLMQIMYL